MRILHVLDHGIPLHSGYTFRTFAILREQRRRGWETLQLTTPKQGPGSECEEVADGLRLLRSEQPDLIALRQRAEVGSGARWAEAQPRPARVRYLDLETCLVGNINTQIDRARMAHSLEVREPLTDHLPVEWLATLPSSLEVRGNEGKFLSKKAMEAALPHDILYRPKPERRMRRQLTAVDAADGRGVPAQRGRLTRLARALPENRASAPAMA